MVAMREKSRVVVVAALVLSGLGAGTAGARAADPTQPDLTVVAISSSPAAPGVGTQVLLTATVQNLGAPTPAGVILGVGFAIDGTQVSYADKDTASLGTGESVTLTANYGPAGTKYWTATAGAHVVTATADDVNRIAESDELDNTLSIPLVVGVPDLQVVSVTSDPASLAAGQHTVFSATVRNTGTGPTPAGTILGVGFAIDGTQVSYADKDRDALPPGGEVTLTADYGPAKVRYWIATAGSHVLTATVDDAARIAESDETNNSLDADLSVAPSPDLVVAGWSMTPPAPNVGDAVLFSATVQNVGLAATPPGTIVGVGFFLDGHEVTYADKDTTSLAPGSSVTLTANYGTANNRYWTATAGRHALEVKVDDVDRILESDETNNVLASTVAVLPNLTVSNVTATPSAPATGDHVVFKAVVRNVGAAAVPAGTTVTVGFSVDGTLVTYADTLTGGLARGASATVTADNGPGGVGYWVATTGAHTVTATADYAGAIAEGNETDNTAAVSLTILPDLRVISIETNPIGPATGAHVVFTATVMNQGSAPVPAGTPVTVGFYIDGVEVSYSDTLKTGLAQGALATVKANWGPKQVNYWNATKGTHALSAKVDFTNQIRESDETNNEVIYSGLNVS